MTIKGKLLFAVVPALVLAFVGLNVVYAGDRCHVDPADQSMVSDGCPIPRCMLLLIPATNDCNCVDSSEPGASCPDSGAPPGGFPPAGGSPTPRCGPRSSCPQGQCCIASGSTLNNCCDPGSTAELVESGGAVIDCQCRPATSALTEFFRIINGILIPLVIIVGILIIVRAGYSIMTSQGNPQELQTGKENLTSAIIGLIFVLMAVSILRVIIKALITGNTDPFS